MNATITPVFTERERGLGWLASTPPDCRHRFTVEGPDQDSANAAFQAAFARWETLDAEQAS